MVPSLMEEPTPCYDLALKRQLPLYCSVPCMTFTSKKSLTSSPKNIFSWISTGSRRSACYLILRRAYNRVWWNMLQSPTKVFIIVLSRRRQNINVGACTNPILITIINTTHPHPKNSPFLLLLTSQTLQAQFYQIMQRIGSGGGRAQVIEPIKKIRRI